MLIAEKELGDAHFENLNCSQHVKYQLFVYVKKYSDLRANSDFIFLQEIKVAKNTLNETFKTS